MFKIQSLLALVFLFCSALAFADGKVDLNTATLQQLEALPGVGPATAESIVAARPFRSIDELKSVPGVGQARFAAVAPFTTVNGRSESALTRMAGEAGALAGKAKRGVTSAADSVEQGAHDEASEARAAAASASAAEKVAASPLAPGEKINVNSASAAELARLPGIGPSKAQAIIAARPFSSPADLQRVKGISSRTFAKVKDSVTIE